MLGSRVDGLDSGIPLENAGRSGGSVDGDVTSASLRCMRRSTSAEALRMETDASSGCTMSCMVMISRGPIGHGGTRTRYRRGCPRDFVVIEVKSAEEQGVGRG